jgi:hypothetical protein
LCSGLETFNRYCRAGSSYFTGSSVAFKTSLKSINAGVVSASIAGQRGWSMMDTFVICRVAVLPIARKVRLSAGADVTQYSPSGEIGGSNSWIWFAGTAGPLNTVSHVWAKIAWCA